MTLTLFYAPGACSMAPHLALEEAGLAYESRLVDFGSAEQRSPAYLAVNPKGRVPALVHDAFVVTENPAILRYVARLVPDAGLWPDDPREEARCTEWMAWCSSTLHPTYAHIRRGERYATSDAAKADIAAKARESCAELWSEIDRKLATTPWAAGERFSVADAYLMFFYHLGRGPVLGYDMPARFPHFAAWAARLGERPATCRVLEREGLAPLP